MNAEERADKIAEWVEHRLAHWAVMPLCTAAIVAGLFWPGVDATNLAISILTVELLLLTLGRDRRDRKALHAKLDDLEIHLPQADSNKAHLEDKTEAEIETARA